MDDEKVKPSKRTGYRFIAAGVMFFLVAGLSKQLSWIIVGVMFIGVGVSHLIKAK